MKFKKGVELPMNTLVVVSIAVIILLAMTAFFIGGFGPFSQDVQLEEEFKKWCRRWVNLNCDPEDPIADRVFEAYNKWKRKYYENSNLETLCTEIKNCYNLKQEQVTEDKIKSEIQRACGCWFIAPITPEEPVPPAQPGGGQGGGQPGQGGGPPGGPSP